MNDNILEKNENPVSIRFLERSSPVDLQTYYPHKHDYVEFILFFQATEVVHHIDFQPFRVNDGDLFILYPGQVHFFEASSATRHQMSVLTIASEYFDQFVKANQQLANLADNLLFEFNSIAVASKAEVFKIIFEEMQREIEEKQAGWEILVGNLVQAMIIHTCRLAQILLPESKNNYLSIFRRFRLLVNTYYLDAISIDAYAEKLNISSRQLHRVVKQQSGTSPSRFIQQRINLEAKRLIYKNQMSIKEIAFYLGFEEINSFNKFFKRLNGLSPTAFKLSLSERDKQWSNWD